MSNDFLWPEEKYQQGINPIGQYIEQASHFLSIQAGIDRMEAEAFVKNLLKTKGATEFHDPQVTYYERDDDWMRNLKTGSLRGYLRSAISNREVIVPTLTTYIDPTVEESLVSKFMKRNATARGVLKKQAQVEEMRGNVDLAYQLNNQQDNAKRNNNSCSGAMAAAGSILENPTGHNTLTSITRSMSSISNALNERMIMGNRHYFHEDVAINNMTVLITTMNTEMVRLALDTYGLKAPTAQDIANIVRKSSDKYWRDSRSIRKIEEYAAKMTPEQRAAVAYTQDLYHIRELNPEFMKTFIEDFAIPDTSTQIDDLPAYFKKVDPLIANYAHQVFISQLRGQDKDRNVWDKELQMKVAQSCVTIERAVQKYKYLIDAFLVVPTLPCSTAHVNHMNRESVVLSDTDSTMFSIDDWVIWYFGKLVFNDYAFAVAGSIMFISTQLIAHAMAILSANMNVAREKLFVLSMKPEFVFPVFAQTPVAKHYFCSVAVKEGAVYKENHYEIKGVHLKNSASPAVLVNASQDRMKKILTDVEAERGVCDYDEVERVADIERNIKNAVMNGDIGFLKKMFIKDPRSYVKPPTESPYRYHTLWNTVFGPSYGEVDAPPYIVRKLPLITTSRKRMVDWLDSLSNRDLARRYGDFLNAAGKTEIKTFYISEDFVHAYGMPVELQQAIDIRKVILDLTVTDRMILDTIGYHPKSETLLSEMGY